MRISTNENEVRTKALQLPGDDSCIQPLLDKKRIKHKATRRGTLSYANALASSFPAQWPIGSGQPAGGNLLLTSIALYALTSTICIVL